MSVTQRLGGILSGAVMFVLCSDLRTRDACLTFHGHAEVAANAWNSVVAAAVHIHMKRQSINDPAYWRERAVEVRLIANQVTDALAKQTLLDIARSYDGLAALTETRPASKTSN